MAKWHGTECDDTECDRAECDGTKAVHENSFRCKASRMLR